MIKKIAKNTFVLLGAEIVSKLFMFFLVIFIARYLGNINFGKYSFAFAFVGLFAVIVDFGFNPLTIRDIAKNKTLTKEYLDNIAVIKLFLGIIAFLIIFIVINLLNKTQEVRLIVYLAGIYVIIFSFNEFFRSIFDAFEKMEFRALVRVIERGALFCLGLLVILLDLGLVNLVLMFVVASSISLIITLALIWKRFSKFSFKVDFIFWKEILKKSWPFALTALFVAIYFRIDIVMLSLMKGDSVVGWYNAAYNIMIVFIIPPTLFVQAIYPVLSNYYKKSINKFIWVYQKSFKMLLGIAIPTAFLITVFAGRLIDFVYGPEFRNSVLSMQILIWAGAVIFLGILTNNTLNSMGKQKTVMWIALAGAFVNVLLNLALIPRFSLVGASIATLITESLVMMLWLMVIAKEMKLISNKA